MQKSLSAIATAGTICFTPAAASITPYLQHMHSALTAALCCLKLPVVNRSDGPVVSAKESCRGPHVKFLAWTSAETRSHPSDLAANDHLPSIMQRRDQLDILQNVAITATSHKPRYRRRRRGKEMHSRRASLPLALRPVKFAIWQPGDQMEQEAK